MTAVRRPSGTSRTLATLRFPTLNKVSKDVPSVQEDAKEEGEDSGDILETNAAEAGGELEDSDLGQSPRRRSHDHDSEKSGYDMRFKLAIDALERENGSMFQMDEQDSSRKTLTIPAPAIFGDEALWFTDVRI